MTAPDQAATLDRDKASGLGSAARAEPDAQPTAPDEGRFLPLGTTLLSRLDLPPRRFARGVASAADAVGLCFVVAGRLCSGRGGGATPCEPGDLLILDMAEPWSIVAEGCASVLALLAPRDFLAQVVPHRLLNDVQRRSAPLDVVRHFLDALVTTSDRRLTAEQGTMLAFAIRELLTAAAVPLGTGGHAGAQREAVLLDAASDHIDAHLTDTLDATQLCRALGASRSALYRAAAPVGGIAELIVQRRLVAVHDLLADPAERRSVADLARTYRFADPAQFGRRFKRVFGTTPSQVRADALAGGDDRPASDPFRAMAAAFARLS